MTRYTNRDWDSVPYVSATLPNADNDDVDTAVLGRAFRVGDKWFCSLTQLTYRCVVNTTGAAVWEMQSHATKTTIHVYANGTSGDDDNDGLDVARPKKTLGAVFALVPDIVKHNVCVHLVGTFDTIGYVYVSKIVDRNGRLLIDGGTDLTPVLPGPFTATVASDVDHIDCGGGLGPNTHAGYFCEIITPAGIATLQHRTIVEHTDTVITPGRNYSAQPDGSTFRISRPTTQITGVGTFSLSARGGGFASIQHLFLDDPAILSVFYADSILLNHIVSNDSGAAIQLRYIETVGLWDYAMNATTFANESSNTDSICGVSQVNNTGHIILSENKIMSLYGTFAKEILFRDSNLPHIRQGTRVWRSEFHGVAGAGSTSAGTNIANSAGYAVTTFGGSTAPGIMLYDSSLAIDDIDVSDCTGFGIVVDHSSLRILGVVTGTGNTLGGVYAHNLSTVNIADGSPPTITGNGGTVEFSTDGSTEASTWAAIDAGVSVSDITEMTMAKEIV